MLSLKGCCGYVKALRAILRIIKTEHITEIHCGRCLPEGWIAWLVKQRYGIPYVCYAHGEDVNLQTMNSDASALFSSRQLRWMMKTILEGVKFVIANSQNTESILKRAWNLPVERIRLLHPGVDTKRFVPAQRNELAREVLGWAHRRVVVTVGRLEIRKGHDQLILALHRIKKAIPDVLYAIIGDGEQRTVLETLVENEGLRDYVQFLGEVDDDRLITCYQQCDLFVLPNRQVADSIEGFGMVLLEAQACGKAVIAGTSGGTSEAMQISMTGRIVPCETPTHLAPAVTELLADSSLRDRMGMAGRCWVVKNFDWSELSRRAGRLFDVPFPYAKSF
jgi:phosphatidylinositol alpha-1,6-mannosyltransferase